MFTVSYSERVFDLEELLRRSSVSQNNGDVCCRHCDSMGPGVRIGDWATDALTIPGIVVDQDRSLSFQSMRANEGLRAGELVPLVCCPSPLGTKSTWSARLRVTQHTQSGHVSSFAVEVQSSTPESPSVEV
jgi:hypothetical protein